MTPLLPVIAAVNECPLFPRLIFRCLKWLNHTWVENTWANRKEDGSSLALNLSSPALWTKICIPVIGLGGKQALQFLIGQLSNATAPLLVGLQAPGFVTVRIKHSLSYRQTLLKSLQSSFIKMNRPYIFLMSSFIAHSELFSCVSRAKCTQYFVINLRINYLIWWH